MKIEVKAVKLEVKLNAVDLTEIGIVPSYDDS